MPTPHHGFRTKLQQMPFKFNFEKGMGMKKSRCEKRSRSRLQEGANGDREIDV